MTVPGHIRAGSTPASMAADRIPPKVDTPVTVTVAGFAAPMKPVTLSIEGSGGANGTVTIDGKTTTDLTGPAIVQLRGGTQTTPGKAGNLKLVAEQGGTRLAASAGFSVSAIPQNYTDVFDSELTGATRGFVVQDGWASDSGDIADLDQADISEEVEVTTATGCFVGKGTSTSGYLPANSFTKDTHSTPVSIMTSSGLRIAQQTCKFQDKRAGAVDIPMRNSGYELTRRVIRMPFGVVTLFRINKEGKATTANGITSGAGVGSITRTQTV